MGLIKKWRIIFPVIVLVAIFIYILWRSTEHINPVNVIGIAIVAGIIIYFSYLANSFKKYR
jgi:hypothetical protein